MTGIKILGTGSYAPENAVLNNDFTAFVETSDEWIQTRTGIRERRVSTDEPTWSLAAKAARRALEAAETAPADIDMIICTTISHDYAFPSMATFVQGALEIPSCIAVDVNVACTGIAFAIDMARRYLAAGDVSKVLIASGESLTQLTDYGDRTTCVLFADAAGALVVEGSDKLFANCQGSDPSGGQYLYCRYDRRENPFGGSADTGAYDLFPEEKRGSTYMNGREVYKFATRAMPESVQSVCEKAGIAVSDIDMLFVHQANVRIVETAAKNLGFPMEKIWVNIDRYGCTSSASLPSCLDECIRAGKLKRGDTICIAGFGAGLYYSACLLEY